MRFSVLWKNGGLRNIDADLLNGIVPIALPIPLWRVGLLFGQPCPSPAPKSLLARPFKAVSSQTPTGAMRRAFTSTESSSFGQMDYFWVAVNQELTRSGHSARLARETSRRTIK